MLSQLSYNHLCMATVKELSVQWLVEMAEYIANNPQFIVNGFRYAGIPSVLDGSEEVEENTGGDSDELSDENYDSDEEFSLDSH